MCQGPSSSSVPWILISSFPPPMGESADFDDPSENPSFKCQVIDTWMRPQDAGWESQTASPPAIHSHSLPFHSPSPCQSRLPKAPVPRRSCHVDSRASQAAQTRLTRPVYPPEQKSSALPHDSVVQRARVAGSAAPWGHLGSQSPGPRGPGSPLDTEMHLSGCMHVLPHLFHLLSSVLPTSHCMLRSLSLP